MGVGLAGHTGSVGLRVTLWHHGSLSPFHHAFGVLFGVHAKERLGKGYSWQILAHKVAVEAHQVCHQAGINRCVQLHAPSSLHIYKSTKDSKTAA